MAENIHSPLPLDEIRQRLETLARNRAEGERPDYLKGLGRAEASVTMDGDAFRVRLHPLPPGIVRFEARGELLRSGAGTRIRLSVLPDRRALWQMAATLVLFVGLSIWRGTYFWALFAFISTIGGALASMSFSRPYADATRSLVREAAGLAPKITFLESTYR